MYLEVYKGVSSHACNYHEICDFISLIFRVINILNQKTLGDNLALKTSIIKAFETLYWNILIKVLHGFGFNDKFFFWNNTIIHVARLSILVNGNFDGLFPLQHEIKQCDPLSHIPFCLVEKVLSKGILRLA